jgi:uncharacterized protein YndB with AHSA1/START domain
MSDHSVAHGTFVVERTYNHPVAKVWAAWSDPNQKAKWFGASSEGMPAQVFDFAPGGRESRKGDIPNGPSFAFDVLYQDIVPNSRIVYNYDMHMNGKKISVSLAAIEFWPEGKQTKLRLTEYGLFLDGLDSVAQRKEGTVGLISQLGDFLDGKRT